MALPLLVAALSVCASACASDETVAAEEALAKWRNKRPQQYTYVMQPTGSGSLEGAVRVKVEQERLLEAIDAAGNEPSPSQHLTMTDLLEEARDLSGEPSFAASYDAELGYVRSFFYGGDPEAYGFDVICLEKKLDEDACSDTFKMQLAP